MKKLIIYSSICAIIFILLPMPFFLQEEFAKSFPLLALLCLNPIYSFVSGILVAFRNKAGLLYPIIVSLIFALSSFIIYNSTALVYAVVYFLLASIGAMIGYFFTRKKSKLTKNK